MSDHPDHPDRPGEPGRPRRRGWTAYMEQTPAETMQEMPRPLATAVTNFVVALAIEAGAAVDAGKQPPGDRLDDHGHRYGIQVQGEPVLLEYTVHPDTREIRLPVLVWFH